MKIKFLFLGLLLALLCGSARAQFPCTTSPNLGLQIPNIGNTTTWGTCLNTDLLLFDTLLAGVNTLQLNAASPSIFSWRTWTAANSSPTVLTNLISGYPGQEVIIVCAPGDTFTSIASNTHFSVGSTWACSSSKAISLVLSGTGWVETGRWGSGGGGSAPGASGSIPYNNSGSFAGSSLTFIPIANGVCTISPNLAPCDNYAMSNSSNTCIGAVITADSTASDLGNSTGFCAALASSGGSVTFGSAVSSDHLNTAIGLTGFASLINATGGAAEGVDAAVTDDPNDTATGQIYYALWAGMSLVRSSGSIATMEGVHIATFNFDTGGGPAAETVGTFYGIHIEDLHAKGTTTAGIQIDSQSGSGLAINVASGGGKSILQSTQVTTLNLSTGNLLLSSTNPTISSGFGGTAPAIVNPNGPTSFELNVGSGTMTSAGVIGLPTAPHGWNCRGEDFTTPTTTNRIKETAFTTTSATISNYTSAGALTNYTASDVYLISCFPF
jgi:hypothetical protein